MEDMYGIIPCGEYFWDVVNGNDTSPPANGLENTSTFKKWKHVNAKAEFIMKRTISSCLFDHILKCKSAHEIWRTSIACSTRRMKLDCRYWRLNWLTPLK